MLRENTHLSTLVLSWGATQENEGCCLLETALYSFCWGTVLPDQDLVGGQAQVLPISPGTHTAAVRSRPPASRPCSELPLQLPFVPYHRTATLQAGVGYPSTVGLCGAPRGPAPRSLRVPQHRELSAPKCRPDQTPALCFSPPGHLPHYQLHLLSYCFV